MTILLALVSMAQIGGFKRRSLADTEFADDCELDCIPEEGLVLTAFLRASDNVFKEAADGFSPG